MTESLIAAGLLFVGVLGVTYIVNILNTSRSKTRFITGAIALESSVVAAVTDPAAYTLDYFQKLQNGVIPAMTVRVNTPFLSPGSGSTGAYFNANIGSSDIVIAGKWRLKMQTFRTNAAKPYTYGFAYTVWAVNLKVGAPAINFNTTTWPNYNPTYHQLDPSIQPLGAKTLTFTAPNNGNNGDYSISIPTSVDVDTINSSTPTKSCDLATTLGLKGIDQFTGNPICLNRPVQSCPDGTLITSMKSVNNQLVWECSQPMKKAVCLDPYYQLNTIYPTNLFRHKGRAFNYAARPGLCVFVANATETFPTAFKTNGSLVGAACPYGYKLASSKACAKQNEKSVPGTCIDYTYAAKTITYYNPSTRTNVQKTYYEATENPVTVPAAAGGITEVQWTDQATRQAMVSCQLNIPAQKCGSRWSAEILLQPTCVLDSNYFPNTKDAAYAD